MKEQEYTFQQVIDEVNAIPNKIKRPICYTEKRELDTCPREMISRNRAVMTLDCGVRCCRICKEAPECRGLCIYIRE